MRVRHAVVLLSAATFGLVAAGCSDDDDDDTIDATVPGNPDLDPGEGSGLPGDAGDEGTDAPAESLAEPATAPVTAAETVGTTG